VGIDVVVEPEGIVCRINLSSQRFQYRTRYKKGCLLKIVLFDLGDTLERNNV